MRPLVVTAFAVFTAAALAAAPASAGPFDRHQHHGGGAGVRHSGEFGGHRHGGGSGWVGPGLVLGLGAAAIAAGIAASQQRNCIRYEDAYDDWGNYIGRRRVNVC